MHHGFIFKEKYVIYVLNQPRLDNVCTFPRLIMNIKSILIRWKINVDYIKPTDTHIVGKY